MNIGNGASLELVDTFCYLGDVLSVDGDADVEARVCKGWNKITCASAYESEITHTSYVYSCMLHGSETWPVKKENKLTLHFSGLR